MSLIHCTSKCIYQKDGICMLDNAVSSGVPNAGGCIHYIPKEKAKYKKKK